MLCLLQAAQIAALKKNQWNMLIFFGACQSCWFGSSLSFFSHVDRNIGIVEWWSNLMELKDELGLQKDVNLAFVALCNMVAHQPYLEINFL